MFYECIGRGDLENYAKTTGFDPTELKILKDEPAITTTNCHILWSLCYKEAAESRKNGAEPQNSLFSFCWHNFYKR